MLNDNFNALGFAVIGIFIVAWTVSVIIYRFGRPAEAPEQREPGSVGLLDETELAIDGRAI